MKVGEKAAGSPCIGRYMTLFQPRCPTAFSCFIPELPLIPNPALLCSAAMAAWFSLRMTASWAPSSVATVWPSCPSPETCRPAAPTCCSRPPASLTSPTLQVRNLNEEDMDCANHEVIDLFAGLGKIFLLLIHKYTDIKFELFGAIEFVLAVKECGAQVWRQPVSLDYNLIKQPRPSVVWVLFSPTPALLFNLSLFLKNNYSHSS